MRQIVEPEPLTLGEDFAIYLQELPGVFWTFGGAATGSRGNVSFA